MKKTGTRTDALMAVKFVPQQMPGRQAIINKLYAHTMEMAQFTAKEMVEKYVQDPELRAVLSGGQLIDWNLQPDKVSMCMTQS